MKVKSIRIPHEMGRAVDYVARSEKIEKTSSLRKLTRMGFELYVAKSYERGKISLREAAKLQSNPPLLFIIPPALLLCLCKPLCRTVFPYMNSSPKAIACRLEGMLFGIAPKDPGSEALF